MRRFLLELALIAGLMLAAQACGTETTAPAPAEQPTSPSDKPSDPPTRVLELEEDGSDCKSGGYTRPDNPEDPFTVCMPD